MLKEAERAAQTLGMQLQFVPAASPDDITSAFSVITRERADALSVFPSPILFAEWGRIANIAADKRLPGASLPDSYRQAGIYVGRILKGEKPADLPVMQPTKFELVINLKTAKALGLTVPDKVLALADEVIE
jgi:putative ABC transport system substrate-binding protein